MASIFLDPGHGGADPGACGNGYKEKDLNLELALQLGRRLAAKGVRVGYSRTADVDAGSVTARGQMAAGYDRFLSLHFNAGGGAGTEIYANCAAEEGGMEQALEAALTPFVGSRGVLSRRYLDGAFVKRGISENGRLLPAVWGLDWYGVLRGCHSVGVGGNLIEVAFIDHAANLAGYLQHKEEIWDALASAVCQGLGVTEPAQPPVPAAPAEPSPSAGGTLYRVFLAENPVQIGAFKDLENAWRFADGAEGREGKSALVKRVQLP